MGWGSVPGETLMRQNISAIDAHAQNHIANYSNQLIFHRIILL